ncbi:MAG: AAA family ATPase [Candidatus Woesearchaeota archaeon]
MRKVCVINQKGGVGKTTTVINLSAGLAQKNKKVLVLDLDPQGNVNTNLCLYAEKNMYHMLVEGADPRECMVHVNDFLHVIPSNSTLSQAELILSGKVGRETVLKRCLEGLYEYDYIIVDCPPSINLLNQNALLFANEAFIPVATEYLAFDALRKVEHTIEEINEVFGHNLRISLVIPTLYDRRIKSCIKILSELKKGYNGLVVTPISINSKLKESPGCGVNIYEHAKHSRGAKDYMRLTEKVIELESAH